MVIRVITPQVSKRLSAAGKPKENNPTATIQLRFPEATEVCVFNLLGIKELNTIKHQFLIKQGVKYFW